LLQIQTLIYQTDQSHPSLEGSYIAAAVFYEVLFQKSVLTNTFMSSISSAIATFLEQAAHDVLRDSLAVWNLEKTYPEWTIAIRIQQLVFISLHHYRLA
jgi:hypothetical protein